MPKTDLEKKMRPGWGVGLILLRLSPSLFGVSYYHATEYGSNLIPTSLTITQPEPFVKLAVQGTAATFSISIIPHYRTEVKGRRQSSREQLRECRRCI